MFSLIVGLFLLIIMGAIIDYYGKTSSSRQIKQDENIDHTIIRDVGGCNRDVFTKTDIELVQEIRHSPEYIAVLRDINSYFDEVEQLRKSYIAHQDIQNIHVKYDSVYNYVTRLPKKLRDEVPCISMFREYTKFNQNVQIWNREFIDNELIDTRELLDNIDGRKLDRDQRIAVITDDDNELIIAGAGSGKTLTLSAKVQYLINRKSVLPEQILLIAFTNKATDELRYRVSSGTGMSVAAKTFHKLGIDIITEANSKPPNISGKKYLGDFIKRYFSETLLTDSKAVNNILTFFGSYVSVPKDLEQYESAADAVTYYRECSISTLRSFANEYIANAEVNEKQTHSGESVRSSEELIIANYLYVNGIEYEYESPYPFSSDDVVCKQYRPDFYLPEYDIYLEHFGISADGRVPWLPKDEEEKYISDMGWKREFHKLHGTKLIETYSYYHTKGILLEKLEELLVLNNVEFHPRDLKDIYLKWIERKYNSKYDDFINLIESFIVHYKSKGYHGVPVDTLRYGSN